MHILSRVIVRQSWRHQIRLNWHRVRLWPDTNHYLKWAYSEAGNSVAVNRGCWPARHVSQLYNRIRGRKGHAKAVARHLAEVTYWMWRKQEAYCEPCYRQVLSTGPAEE